jgi:uncharacterized protein involved in type VI secretion and phage assembly
MRDPSALHPPYAVPDLGRAHLARVVSVKDPDGLSRVQVRLLACDGPDGQDAPVWARVAAPFAGKDRGAFFIPDVDDEVLVVFVDADRRFPVVVGSLWNGHDTAPETLGGDGGKVDRWTITGKAGTRIAIVEETAGQETVSIETPGGVTVTITDDGGGKVEIECAQNTVTIDSSGVSVQSQASVQVQASDVTVNATSVSVNAGMATFSDTVQCSTLIATTVVSSTYMTGAGNVL